MITIKSFEAAFVVIAALTLAACGGASNGSTRAQTSSEVTSAGATLKAGGVVLSIPPSALTAPVQVTLRETEPHHQGRAARVEVEPHGLQLDQPAQVSIEIAGDNIKVRMTEDDDTSEHLVDVEVEDRNHHAFKTSMTQLGAIEVEVEHGAACDPACAAGQECDDGLCKPHFEDPGAGTCDPICAEGMECDDGLCKAHGADGGAPPGAATCTPSCATGLECEDGVCKAHGSGGLT